MPAATEPTVSVTLAEIARIAGVGRAAVSNWRRRYEDFPSPVGGTDISPQFELGQVEEWLRSRDKLKDRSTSLEWLWPRFEALGDRDTTGVAIAAVAGRASPDGATDAFQLTGVSLRSTASAAQRRAVEHAVRLAATEGGPETFGFLLDRWLKTHVRQISATPAPLAELMADLATAAGARPRTVLDPACGTGVLLQVAAERWGTARRPVQLWGQDIDPVPAALARARLSMSVPLSRATARISGGDTLRADAWPDERVDLVLCNPPYNERDWGHEELTTDPRWAYGHPPRTESELAWVQHALARLNEGGVAVLLVPPAVASRRAGRRVRAALLRDGALRAVIALPPGAAPPHGVALQLWLLSKPGRSDTGSGSGSSDGRVLLVDTAPAGTEQESGKATIDWESLRGTVRAAVQGLDRPSSEEVPGSKAVPVIDLLDELVDLTPARHVPRFTAGLRLRRSWTKFGSILRELQDLTAVLSHIEPSPDGAEPQTTTVEELVRAGALEIRDGRNPGPGLIRRGETPRDGVPLLTVADTLRSGTRVGWVASSDIDRARGELTVTVPEEVVVIGGARGSDAWVDTEAPTVLGAHVYALRANPDLLDPWFLAGCLRSPANGRQAGSHASTTSRVNVRRLRVLRLPLTEQRVYAEPFRRLAEFERALGAADEVGRELARGLSDALVAGGLPRG
ncbi:HsdM family class I SAM-dependent methyltransferase [Streptomyces harbinensis]